MANPNCRRVAVSVIFFLLLRLVRVCPVAGRGERRRHRLDESRRSAKDPRSRARKKKAKSRWYTTLIVDQVVRPVKDAFEKEYPFLQVEFFRGNSERIVQKMIAEYQAKRYDVDIIDGTVSPTMVRRAGYAATILLADARRISRRAQRCPGFLGHDQSVFFRHRL